jgi:hypothetical protein
MDKPPQIWGAGSLPALIDHENRTAFYLPPACHKPVGTNKHATGLERPSVQAVDATQALNLSAGVS